jgi:hypothetical protein
MYKNKIVAKNTPSKYFNSANIFEFEDWMLDPDGTSHALGAAFALAGIPDDRYIKLSARQQKLLWGKAYIGKKTICLTEGQFRLIWSSGFGQDRENADLFNYIRWQKGQQQTAFLP